MSFVNPPRQMFQTAIAWLVENVRGVARFTFVRTMELVFTHCFVIDGFGRPMDKQL